MKMPAIIAIVCLAVLLWVESATAQAATAQKEYALKVSIHKNVRPKLTKKRVEEILKGASDLLKEANCDVKFKLDGRIKSFSSAPDSIRDATDLDAVHAVAADVKIVD